jgi:hypothetical protein
MTFQSQHRLQQLELFVTDSEVKPIKADPWLLTSLLQKAIRRGDVLTAKRAASSLWQIDRQRLWRRLHIIALEDISIADLETVLDSLHVTANPIWRRKVGDRQMAVLLAERLSKAVKCRVADHLLIHAEKGHRPYPPVQLTDMAADIGDRARGLWLLAGTRKYPSDRLPKAQGDYDRLIELLYELGVSPDIVDAALSVASRSPWPLAVMLPLICQVYDQPGHLTQIVTQPLDKGLTAKSVPTYAADMFTRVGRESYRAWRDGAKALQPFSIDQIGMAVFYEEGCKVNRLLTSPALTALETSAELLDGESVGLIAPEFLGLRDLVRNDLPALQEIRATKLNRLLA